MKKILMLALLSIAFTAVADDYYLYWMVADEATVTAMDGTESALTTHGGTVYARIRGESSTSGETTYLNIYSSREGGEEVSLQAIETECVVPYYVGIFTSRVQPEGMTYWVELYNSQTIADSSWIGQAQLAWDDSYVTSSGMATPASYSLVSQFSAAPEPTSGLLLLVGLAGLALRRRNKRA